MWGALAPTGDGFAEPPPRPLRGRLVLSASSLKPGTNLGRTALVASVRKRFVALRRHGQESPYEEIFFPFVSLELPEQSEQSEA